MAVKSSGTASVLGQSGSAFSPVPRHLTPPPSGGAVGLDRRQRCQVSGVSRPGGCRAGVEVPVASRWKLAGFSCDSRCLCAAPKLPTHILSSHSCTQNTSLMHTNPPDMPPGDSFFLSPCHFTMAVTLKLDATAYRCSDAPGSIKTVLCLQSLHRQLE